MDKVAELLEKLAKQLGTTVEYLWTVLLKQAHVEMVLAMVAIAISVVILAISLWILPKAIRQGNKTDWCDEGCGIAYTGTSISIVTIITTFIVICVNIPVAVTTWLNPEYWALQQIGHLFH